MREKNKKHRKTEKIREREKRSNKIRKKEV